MIKCEICKKKQAKLHITQIKDNQKYTLHICHDCAHENGIAGPSVNTTFSIEGLFSGQSQSASKTFSTATEEQQAPEVDIQRTCTHCGLSYGAFKESGRLGCSHCYEVFADQLKPLLQKVQKDAKHVGKIPHSGDTQMVLKRNISDLRTQLKEAVSQENFEDAARLRDQIRQLEGELSRMADDR